MTETITQSSLIEKFSHEEDKSILHVHFRKGGHYLYNGVSKEDFEAFRSAESHGKHFLANIKNKYEFAKARE